MSVDQGLVDWITDALEPMGMVTLRKMMGGATLYLDGTLFAIAFDDALWFKADAQSNALWDAAGCPRFTYVRRDGRGLAMNYRRAPEDVYDDPDLMRQWAGPALEAGRRTPPGKRKKRKK